jgi:membrane-associated phospholipid phosphatase
LLSLDSSSHTQNFDITEFLNDLNIKNRGIIGDRTDQVLDGLDDITRYKPKKIFIEIGINDLLQGISVDSTFKNTKQIISTIRQKSRFVDEYIAFIARNNLFKGVVLMSALWWWFLPGIQDRLKRRMMIILALLSGFIAIVIGRILIITLPFSMRPMNSPELHLIIPFGANKDGLAKMSSFPSDHAALFYALCTGLFLISKKTGVLAFLLRCQEYIYVIIILLMLLEER